MVHSGLTRLGHKVTTALLIILKHVSVFCFGENISNPLYFKNDFSFIKITDHDIYRGSVPLVVVFTNTRAVINC